MFQRLSALLLSFTHRSHRRRFLQAAVVFNDKALKTLRTLPAQHPTADRDLKQLDGEHSGAFSS